MPQGVRRRLGIGNRSFRSNVKELLLVFVGDAVGESDAVVGKGEGGHDGVGLAFQHEKVCFPEQAALVDEAIFGEELVEVIVVARKRLALGEPLRGSANDVALGEQLVNGHIACVVLR